MAIDSIRQEAVRALQDYKESSYKKNELLRNGGCVDECKIIDELFTETDDKMTLYRGLSGNYVKDGYYIDDAYVSTSKSLSIALFDFAKGENPTLLIINVPEGVATLDMEQLLSSFSSISFASEEEVILPRHTKLKLLHTEFYSPNPNSNELPFSEFYRKYYNLLNDTLGSFNNGFTVQYLTVDDEQSD